jgi:hypothetical protein
MAKVVSKGSMNSVAASDLKVTQRERSYTDNMVNINSAWEKGQNPWLTVPNSDPSITNKKMVRVRTNSVWGDPRGRNKGFVNQDTN